MVLNLSAPPLSVEARALATDRSPLASTWLTTAHLRTTMKDLAMVTPTVT